MKVGEFEVEVTSSQSDSGWVATGILPGGQKVISGPASSQKDAIHDVMVQAEARLYPMKKIEFTKKFEAMEPRSPYLYHATHRDYIPSIRERGLVPMQRSNWVKAANKRRYGSGEIHTFENFHDAVRWAAKMDWEFNQEIGSGKISIVRLKRTGQWAVDNNDPVSQLGSKGQWLKRMSKVDPADIDRDIPLTSQMARKLTGSEEEVMPEQYFESMDKEKAIVNHLANSLLEANFASPQERRALRRRRHLPRPKAAFYPGSGGSAGVGGVTTEAEADRLLPHPKAAEMQVSWT